jgi:hypothetical protein
MFAATTTVTYSDTSSCDVADGGKSYHTSGDSFTKTYDNASVHELFSEMVGIRYSQVPVTKFDVIITPTSIGITIVSRAGLCELAATDISGVVSTCQRMADDGVVHGDITKDNIVEYEGVLCLVDYGLVTSTRDVTTLTQGYLNFAGNKSIAVGAVNRANFALSILQSDIANGYVDGAMVIYNHADSLITSYIPRFVRDHLDYKQLITYSTSTDLEDVDYAFVSVGDKVILREVYSQCSIAEDIAWIDRILSLLRYATKYNVSTSLAAIAEAVIRECYSQTMADLVSHVGSNCCRVPFFDLTTSTVRESLRLVSMLYDYTGSISCVKDCVIGIGELDLHPSRIIVCDGGPC